uniref:Uncharacterized protein n=1 Tax=Anguilla anguilla TaxID=7936 RepID=A0A0E9WVF7_ANGAN
MSVSKQKVYIKKEKKPNHNTDNVGLFDCCLTLMYPGYMAVHVLYILRYQWRYSKGGESNHYI